MAWSPSCDQVAASAKSLEGSQSSGERDEAVRQVVHPLFALVHGCHTMQLSQRLMRHLTAEQPDRDDAKHPASGAERRQRAHP